MKDKLEAMELKPNMYVRTNDGYISNVNNINDKNIYNNNFLKLGIIKKSSYNIIDILEVGDYVNGYKVTGIGGTYHGRKDIAIYCDYQENEKTGKWIMIYDDEIKSIVTKEQFSSIEYRLGDDE